MDTNQVLAETKKKLAGVTAHLSEEMKKLRTGRAHPGMLDGVMVEVYGQNMPLKAAASIAAPEAQLLQVTPFDPGNLEAIVAAIRDNQSLGMNPADDGRVIRVQIPPLTTETRQQMVKMLGQKVEEAFVSARQIRHDAFKRAEQAEKSKQIGRDELARFEKQVDELLAGQKAEIEAMSAAKEKEILTV
jgi:ribosome recycling factor